MPIYQHLSRNKNTVVIGKVMDSLSLVPIKHATVTAKMTGYQCETRQIDVDQEGIFKIEYPHLRNNYPFTVELRVTSGDDNLFSEVKREVMIGGILRAPHMYVEIPMSSTSNSLASSEILTYQSYIIDSQQLQPLKQEDVTVYISKMSPQETSNVVTVFPD
jgi:hypothetical protein